MADARPHHGSEAQSASPEGSEQVDVQPFRLTSVAEGFGNKLSCLCPWGEALLVGLADGGLLVFQRKSTPAGVAQQDGRRPSASGAAQWHAARVYRSFGRKAILQLLTIQHTQEPQQQQQQHQNHATSSQAEFLLSLSDDGLNVLSLPKMSLICEAPKSRGALCFSWDASRSLLAVATRRRVYIHHFNGKDVIELKDFPVPDMVLAIPGSSELLLLRDHLAVFAGHNGAPSRRLQVQWSATPLAVCLAWPYAVAMMPTFIEVRNVHRASTHAVVQQIQQDELGIVPPCVSNDGTVFVGSRTLGTIAALCSTPFLEQAQQLGSAGLYQEALLMCEIADEGDAAAQQRKEALQDELRMWYGMRLFRDGEWDEGMAQLGRCSHPDPLLLLHLFPALVPSELLVGLPSCIPDGARGAAYRAPQGDAYVSAVTQLLPYLWSHHSRLSSVLQDAQAAAAGPDGGAPRDGDGQLPYQHLDAAQQRQLAEVIDTAILKALLATEDFYALGRFAQRTNRVSLLAGQQALQDAGRYKELTDLLWSHGRHQDALQLLDLVATAPSQLPQPPRGPAAELHGVAGAWAGVKLLVSLVPADMELIQANASWILGLDPDSALPLFLETQPPVDPAGALQVLRSAAPASCAAYLEEALARGVAVPQIAHEELVQLYLEAVTGRTGADGSPLPAEEAARKLKHLVCVSPHIAVESLLWKLPSGRLHDIRALLLGRSGRYSEALGVYVHQLQDIRAAESLCDTVYVAHSVAAPPAAAAEQAARAGLEDDAAPGQPVEELDAALVGIVPELTEEPHRIYLMLLLAVLDHNPPGRYGARNAAGGVGSVPQEVWEAVVRLLSRKRERLDPLEVLDLLPEDELTVAAFMQFLNSTMRAASQQRRHLSLLLQLCRSEHLQVAAQLAAAQQQYVVVEPERCCVICRKRIGLSALMRHPGGDMVHYGCFQRQALAASRSSLEPAADSGPHPFSVAGL